MRRSLILTGLLFLAGTLAGKLNLPAQEDKNAIKPIEVVKLDRKEPIVFQKDIEPILAAKCTVCHSGPVKEGKFDLGTYDALMKGGKRGKSVIPGKAEESLLYKSAGRTAKPFMPPKGEKPLSPQELALIKLWIDEGAKAPTGVREKPKAVVTAPPSRVQPVRALAISPDKSMVVASRGNQIHLYEAGSGKHVRTLVDPNVKGPDQKPIEAAHLSLVESMAFAPDGSVLVTGSYQEVTVWDPKEGTVKNRLTGFSDRVVALAFSHDGKLLATGGGGLTDDGEIKVFELPEFKQAVEIKNGHSDTVYGVCFSPDGSKLATAAADKFVKVWELPSGKFIKSFEGHTHHVLDVGWKADGKLLVSAGADLPSAVAPSKGHMKVWDYEKGERVRDLPVVDRQVTRLRFVGKTSVIVVCSGDGQARRYNIDNGAAQGQLPGSATDYLYAVDASPDGTLIAVGGEEGVVRVYDGAKLTRTLLPPGIDPKK
jgi:WD40 repeat protein